MTAALVDRKLFGSEFITHISHAGREWDGIFLFVILVPIITNHVMLPKCVLLVIHGLSIKPHLTCVVNSDHLFAGLYVIRPSGRPEFSPQTTCFYQKMLSYRSVCINKGNIFWSYLKASWYLNPNYTRISPLQADHQSGWSKLILRHKILSKQYLTSLSVSLNTCQLLNYILLKRDRFILCWVVEKTIPIIFQNRYW